MSRGHLQDTTISVPELKSGFATKMCKCSKCKARKIAKQCSAKPNQVHVYESNSHPYHEEEDQEVLLVFK